MTSSFVLISAFKGRGCRAIGKRQRKNVDWPNKKVDASIKVHDPFAPDDRKQSKAKQLKCIETLFFGAEHDLMHD